MDHAKRTFLIVEQGAQAPATTRQIEASAAVEVDDLTTRSVLWLKASQVSLYRHTLRLQGKCFRILNITECFA